MKMRDTAVAGFALLLVATLVWVWLVPAGLQQAPNVSFRTIDGRAIELAQLRGRPVMVNFWATTCPGCVKEMPALANLYRELSPRGLEIIGVAMDYDVLNDVVALAKVRQIPYPIIHDSQAKTARAFGAVSLTPTTVLIAPDGRIVEQNIGELDMAETRTKILAMLSLPKSL